MFNLYFRAGMMPQAPRVKNIHNQNIPSVTMHSLDSDCFVKRSNYGVEFAKDDRIERIFDETCNEVLRDISYSNPVISEINLPRPYLRTDKSAGIDDASYNFADNEMTFSENYDDDMYIIISKDEKGGVIERKAANAGNLDRSIQSLQALYGGNIEVLKLTDAEKDFKLKAAIAHQMRHYIQNHLAASTEGVKDEMKAEYENIFKRAQELQDRYIEACEKEGAEPDAALISMRMPDYWNRYKPHCILEENAAIKLSSNRKDNRMLSVKSIKQGLSEELAYGKYGGSNYLGRPSEIDANNFEAEYIKKFAKINNVRQEVSNYFASQAEERCKRGIACMKDNGVSFV